MIKNIVRYLGLALVIVGIVLVMKNLFSTDTENWGSKSFSNTNSKTYYTANIKLLSEEDDEYIVGSKLVLKDENDKVVDEWKTEDKEHAVVKLESGTYVLEQVETVDGYVKSDKVITFKITDDDKDIVMYNAVVVEEVKETASEVSVDNTLSVKSSVTAIVAGITILLGMIMVVFPNNKFMIKEK